MHGAPSVSYPVGRSRWGAGFLLLAWLAGLAAWLAWSWQAPLGGRQAAGALAVLAGGALAWRSHRLRPQGRLAWDRQWHWAGHPDWGTLHGVSVVADLQRAMLLRLRGPGGGGWAWVDQACDPAAWAALRRAVYSRAGAGADTAAQPAAEP